MQVDEDFNIRFVKLVQKYKCLYDKKVPEYRNKDFQEKSWLEIAAETRESVPHCKERWRNLRACLSRYIKQQQSADPQHKPYYLTEHMQFVLPFLKSARLSAASNSSVISSTHNNNNNDDNDNNNLANSNNNNTNSFNNYDMKSEVNTQDHHSVHDPEETEDGFENATITTIADAHHHHHHHHHQHHQDQQQQQHLHHQQSINQRLNEMIPTQVNCIPDVPPNVVIDVDQQSNSNERLPPPPEPEVMFMTSSSISDRLQSERKRIKIEHHYADENSDLDFFKSILQDISSMSSLQKRKFKIGVLELIDDVLEKYPIDKGNFSQATGTESSTVTSHRHNNNNHHHQQQQQHNYHNRMMDIPNGYWRKS